MGARKEILIRARQNRNKSVLVEHDFMELIKTLKPVESYTLQIEFFGSGVASMVCVPKCQRFRLRGSEFEAGSSKKLNPGLDSSVLGEIRGQGK